LFSSGGEPKAQGWSKKSENTKKRRSGQKSTLETNPEIPCTTKKPNEKRMREEKKGTPT